MAATTSVPGIAKSDQTLISQGCTSYTNLQSENNMFIYPVPPGLRASSTSTLPADPGCWACARATTARQAAAAFVGLCSPRRFASARAIWQVQVRPGHHGGEFALPPLQGGETGRDKGNGRILAAQLKWNEYVRCWSILRRCIAVSVQAHVCTCVHCKISLLCSPRTSKLSTVVHFNLNAGTAAACGSPARRLRCLKALTSR